MKLLSVARDLRRRKARARHRLFVAEGVRSVEALLDASFGVRGALLSPALDATPRGAALRVALRVRGVDTLDVSAADFASAADTDSPQGVLAIAEQPTTALDDVALEDDARLVVLDGLQDPGNVGTIVRTAAALGAAVTLALPGTVDLWSAKVVRSAMGAHFHHRTVDCTWAELDAFRRSRDVALWAADGAGAVVDAIARDAPRRLALAIGNEGAGLSADVRARADRLVAIPSTSLVESLNASVAAAILLYALRPSSLRGPD